MKRTAKNLVGGTVGNRSSVDYASLVRSIYQSFNDRDYDKTVSFAASDLEWRNTVTGETFHGPEGLREFLDQWVSEFPDAKLEITKLLVRRSSCTVEFIGQGHRVRPRVGQLAQLSSPGTPLRLRFRHILEFANARLVRAQHYQDACPPHRVFHHGTASLASLSPPIGVRVQAIAAGATPNFSVQFDPSAPNGAGLAAAVLGACERDYATLRGWFGNIAVSGLPFHITIQPGSKGASHKNCSSTDISCDAFTGTDNNLLSALVVAEVTEVLEASQNAGWDCGASNGEALSRILATELYPNELSPPGTGVTFASGSNWLDGGRPDWIDSTEQTDTNFVSIGCGTLFLNWLHYQLGFSWNNIIAVGGTTLAETSKRLTGWTNSFSQFSALLAIRYPPGPPSGLTTDNPFPIAQQVENILLQGLGSPYVFVIAGRARFELPDSATLLRLFPNQPVNQLAPALLDSIDTVPVDGTLVSEDGAVSVIFGRAKFRIPDPQTLARLFSGVPVHQLWTNALVAISLIPVDGTFFREESSSIVFSIQNGRKRVVSSGTIPQPIHVLWRGALAQIPSWPTVIQGRITDTAGKSVADASVSLVGEVLVTPLFGNSVYVSADQQGFYITPGVPGGVYDASVSDSGHLPSRITITVPDGVITVTQDFVLTPALPFTIQGSVTDSGMSPVSGATVTLVQNAPVPGYLTTETDAAGSYSISMNPGSYVGSYGISAVAAGFERVDASVPLIPNGATITQNFALQNATPGTIQGKVTDRQGNPIHPAMVALGYTDTIAIAYTDSAGNYSISNVLSGPSLLTAAARGYQQEPQAVTVIGGQTVNVNFRLNAAPPPPRPPPRPGPGPHPLPQ